MYSRNQIYEMMKSNDKVLYGAIVALYEQQTVSEKINETANNRNYRGFNAADAKVMTSLAKHLMRNRCLTDKQKKLALIRIEKYGEQLVQLQRRH